MTDDPKRRIDDNRPAIALRWDDASAPARAPFARPNQWTILLTSSNHGVVAEYGHTFAHASENHITINVFDEATVAVARKRVLELEEQLAECLATTAKWAAAAGASEVRHAQARAIALEEAISAIPGGSICDPQHVADAIRALIPGAPPASQGESIPTDGELLDYLDAWVAANKAEGWGEFNFCFNTSGTAREQIAGQIKDDTASQSEGGAA